MACPPLILKRVLLWLPFLAYLQPIVTVIVWLFSLGLTSIPVEEIIPDPDKVIINVIEWDFASLLFSWYVLPWLGWRNSSFKATLHRPKLWN